MASISTKGFWKPKPVSHRQILQDDEQHDGRGGEHVAGPFNFATTPLAQQRLLLPIYKHKRQILYAVENFAVVVIVGETGSGKSTQIPSYLFENGWADKGFQVVCTQPRRIAAQTLARRVSQELGCPLGREVGYTVRFDDCASPHHTRIKFVTDGMLLREATLSDPLLSRYSVIMIDEAHERNLNSDALLGCIKMIQRKRGDSLRVVICSATIDAEAFLNFFVPKRRREKTPPAAAGRKRRWDQGQQRQVANSPDDDDERRRGGTIISVDGRQYPVDVLYVSDPVPDYIKACVETALKIHEAEAVGGGDILVFLPSGEDVDSAIRLAEEAFGSTDDSKQRKVAFLPLYGSLPYQMQARVFQPKTTSEQDTRHVVFATNIAETSVTVPSITSVIDCGFAKIPFFDPRTGFERLMVASISQASAQQRTGRAGRVQAGKCYRLYQEAYFLEKMTASTPPEVLRSNLTSFVLTLKALGIGNILAFELMDMPSVDALSHALECLYALGALDDRTNLTDRGFDMSAFPTEPRVSRMLLESLELRCAWEVLSVAAALQVRSLLLQPRTSRQQVDYDSAIADLADRSGDHVTYANLITDMDDREMDQEECREKFVNFVALRGALEVRDQLVRFLRRYGKVRAIGGDEETRSRAIRKCVTAGFFFNVARLANDGRYYTVRGKHMVTPGKSSVLHSYGDVCEYIVFAETYDGPRGGIEIRHCSTIEARWLREIAPHYWE